MGTFLARQPNGKICRFSSAVDTITHMNLSDTDSYLMEFLHVNTQEEVNEKLKTKLHPFSDVIANFYPISDTQEEFLECLREMGDTTTQLEDLNTIE